jgi:hypothetical protein
MEMMTAGGVTLAGLGALVGLAIGSSDGGQKLVAQRAQPVEVRTQIIRKTINVYRKEHPHRATGPGGRVGPGSASGTYLPARTRASGGSGAVAATSEAPTIRTRSSGSSGASGSAPSGTPTVRTRTSGASSSGGAPGSSRPVTTRSSGGGEGGDGGGHGD